MPTELKGFNLKKTNKYAENETWMCKFNQKAGYQKCNNVVKLEYRSHSAEVVVYDNGEEHRHEVDPEYVTGGKKYLWSKVQEEIMLPLAMNKLSAVPDDPDQSYIVDWSIDDSDVVTGKPRFSVTFSTVNLLKRFNNAFIQDDSTYKMNWMKYPVLTHGVSTATGRFFFTHVTLSSHEDTKSWATNFSFVKRMAGIPRFNMADGAWEISRATKEVFGDSIGTLRTRLMCWSHVYRNIRPKLATIRKTNKLLAESILSDIEALQWMCQTAAEFNRLTTLLVEHYSTNASLSANELHLVSTFFAYFLAQWGPGSHVQVINE